MKLPLHIAAGGHTVLPGRIWDGVILLDAEGDCQIEWTDDGGLNWQAVSLPWTMYPTEDVRLTALTDTSIRADVPGESTDLTLFGPTPPTGLLTDAYGGMTLTNVFGPLDSLEAQNPIGDWEAVDTANLPAHLPPGQQRLTRTAPPGELTVLRFISGAVVSGGSLPPPDPDPDPEPDPDPAITPLAVNDGIRVQSFQAAGSYAYTVSITSPSGGVLWAGDSEPTAGGSLLFRMKDGLGGLIKEGPDHLSAVVPAGQYLIEVVVQNPATVTYIVQAAEIVPLPYTPSDLGALGNIAFTAEAGDTLISSGYANIYLAATGEYPSTPHLPLTGVYHLDGPTSGAEISLTPPLPLTSGAATPLPTLWPMDRTAFQLPAEASSVQLSVAGLPAGAGVYAAVPRWDGVAEPGGRITAENPMLTLNLSQPGPYALTFVNDWNDVLEGLTLTATWEQVDLPPDPEPEPDPDAPAVLLAQTSVDLPGGGERSYTFTAPETGLVRVFLSNVPSSKVEVEIVADGDTLPLQPRLKPLGSATFFDMDVRSGGNTLRLRNPNDAPAFGVGLRIEGRPAPTVMQSGVAVNVDLPSGFSQQASGEAYLRPGDAELLIHASAPGTLSLRADGNVAGKGIHAATHPQGASAPTEMQELTSNPWLGDFPLVAGPNILRVENRYDLPFSGLTLIATW